MARKSDTTTTGHCKVACSTDLRPRHTDRYLCYTAGHIFVEHCRKPACSTRPRRPLSLDPRNRIFWARPPRHPNRLASTERRVPARRPDTASSCTPVYPCNPTSCICPADRFSWCTRICTLCSRENRNFYTAREASANTFSSIIFSYMSQFSVRITMQRLEKKKQKLMLKELTQQDGVRKDLASAGQHTIGDLGGSSHSHGFLRHTIAITINFRPYFVTDTCRNIM